MKENKNALNDDVITIVWHVPLLLDDMLEDVQNNDESKCHCGCSCCVDNNEDDVNIDDLIGDLTSFDELLNSLLDDEHNKPSEKNEEYKPSKKEKKMLVDSPVKVEKKKCNESVKRTKLVTASEIREKQFKDNKQFDDAVDAVLAKINTEILNTIHNDKSDIFVWINPINFNEMRNLSFKRVNEVVNVVENELKNAGYIVEVNQNRRLITIKW